MYRDLGKVRTNTCRECGKQWETPAKGRPAVFCSNNCRTTYTKQDVPCSVEGCDKQGSKRDAMCPMHRARLRNTGNLEGSTPKVCAHCGGEWVKSPSQGTKRFKYCSDKCYAEAMHEQDVARKAANSPKRTIAMRVVRYNLTQERFNALYEAQNGCCAICGEHKNKDSTDRAHRLYVDHDHSCCPGSQKTCGKCVRALLCWHCNSGLGHFRDDVERLTAAAAYIEKFRTANPTA